MNARHDLPPAAPVQAGTRLEARPGTAADAAAAAGTGLHVVGTSLQLSCGTLHGSLMGTLVWVEPLIREADARAMSEVMGEALPRAASGRA